MNSTTEQLLEKKNLLEAKLKRTNTELIDVLNVNDSLALENKEKDETIRQKEIQLAQLQEKDKQEIEQYLQERTCMTESFSHEIGIIENSISNLEDLKLRYDNLQQENADLSSSLEKIKKKMSVESKYHAKALHEMNKNMKSMRQQMEATFRKELVDMDLHFQSQAFAALDDRKKKAMLANSKLKDELALQSIGISNLSVRSGRDKQSFRDVKNKMKEVGQLVNARRQKLSDLQMRKMKCCLNICNYESKLAEAKLKETKMKAELDQWPSYEELDDAEGEIEKALESQQSNKKVWSNRFKKTRDLELDYKKSSYISSKALNKSLLGHSSQEVSCAETLAMLKSCEGSKNLEKALKPIRGKESTLLSSEGTVSSCVSEIIQILEALPNSNSLDCGSASISEYDGDYELKNASRTKKFINVLRNMTNIHSQTSKSAESLDSMSEHTVSSLGNSTDDGSNAFPLEKQQTGEGRIWFSKEKSADNTMTTSNVMSMGKDKSKWHDLTLDPPLLSNDLIEKIRHTASAPNLGSPNSVTMSSTSKKKLKGSKAKCVDPLSSSKNKLSHQRSLSSVELRSTDRKAEKIMKLMAKAQGKIK